VDILRVRKDVMFCSVFVGGGRYAEGMERCYVVYSLSVGGRANTEFT
jgi:hypothetical protein